MANIRWLIGLGDLLAVVATGGYVMAAEAPFFQGKTITAIVAQTPDGTGGLRARTVLQQLPKYISGNPAIVIQYMGGGGGNTPPTIWRRGSNATGSPSRISSPAFFPMPSSAPREFATSSTIFHL